MNTQTYTLDDLRWQAVLGRDALYDGQFVTAVRTTKIYCKPSCSARTPKRENVSFFVTPEQAEMAGYRACKRCLPDKFTVREPHLELAQKICRALEAQTAPTLSLAQLAKQFHLSPYHLQRTFKRIVGVTPKQYALAARVQRFKNELRQARTVTEAALEAGYNGSSRVYEQPALGMKPQTYKRGGEAAEIAYTVVQSALGYLLVAATPRGICSVKLGSNKHALEVELRHEFPSASLLPEHAPLQSWVSAITEYLAGKQPHLDLPTDVRATAFQRRVWEELRRIPVGQTLTYSQVAERIGNPKAVRAVARACAVNPTALVVPCHRVIGTDKKLHGYRWGLERKAKLLENERQLAES